MCAILDSNVLNDVFKPSRSGAFKGFYEWLVKGKGSLVFSEKFLKDEILHKNTSFEVKKTFSEFQSSGIANEVKPDKLNPEREFINLHKDRLLSNDFEILAIARATKSRLLFTNDRRLHQDFRNRAIVDTPKRVIYTTVGGRTQLSQQHKDMLKRTDICPQQTGYKN